MGDKQWHNQRCHHSEEVGARARRHGIANTPKYTRGDSDIPPKSQLSQGVRFNVRNHVSGGRMDGNRHETDRSTG